jgi:hypothetical protein
LSDLDISGHHEHVIPGLADVPQAFISPRRLFARIEDTGSYAWPLIALLGLVTLLGYLEVQTGLIDRVVDQQTQDEMAMLESSRTDLVDRVALRDQMDAITKNGEFMKMMQRLKAIVATPVVTLASILLISSMLYAAVALSGRKPEYHTLMTICIYASFVELAGILVRLAMMISYRTIHVSTSLEMLMAKGKAPYLAAIDPFVVWFWILIFLGVTTTQQLSRKMAVAACVPMFIIGAGVRVGIAYVSA